MKDLNLGDVLENGSVVEATMKIDNKKDKVPLNVIPSDCDYHREGIYVTGLHLVYDKLVKQFIKVENYSNAKISKMETDWFCCLITSDHKIKIGEEVFWDWEDHMVCRILYDENLRI
jgi:hypothetical protein